MNLNLVFCIFEAEGKATFQRGLDQLAIVVLTDLAHGLDEPTTYQGKFVLHNLRSVLPVKKLNLGLSLEKHVSFDKSTMTPAQH